MKKTKFTAFLILLLACAASVFAFPGLGNADGSHWSISAQALESLFGKHQGTIVSVKTMPIYGIESYGFENPTATDIILWASGGPDLYNFGIQESHSQSYEYKYNKQMNSEELETFENKSVTDYLVYCAGFLRRIEAQWADGNTREAAYLTGFFMHTFEDLFAHGGITNAQHLWLEDNGENPDYNADSYLAAVDSTGYFLESLLNNLSSEAAHNFMQAVTSDAYVEPLSEKEIKKILGKGRDIYIEGIIYVAFTKAPENCMTYAEQIKWDSETLVKIFCSPVYFEKLAAIKNTDEADDLLNEAGYTY